MTHRVWRLSLSILLLSVSAAQAQAQTVTLTFLKQEATRQVDGETGCISIAGIFPFTVPTGPGFTNLPLNVTTPLPCAFNETAMGQATLLDVPTSLTGTLNSAGNFVLQTPLQLSLSAKVTFTLPSDQAPGGLAGVNLEVDIYDQLNIANSCGAPNPYNDNDTGIPTWTESIGCSISGLTLSQSLDGTKAFVISTVVAYTFWGLERVHFSFYDYYTMGSTPTVGDAKQPPPTITRGAPTPSDSTFVAMADPSVSSQCIFSPNQITINIPVQRYIAPAYAEGYLQNVSWLTKNGVIGAKARLTLRVWDVDSGATSSGGVAPEVDNVSINGHPIGTLTGQNQRWVSNEFSVPIEYVKFSDSLWPWEMGQPGVPPLKFLNQITIDVDVNNKKPVWCTSLAWASLDIFAMAPWILVHGTNADHTTWEFIPYNQVYSPAEYLEYLNIPFEYKIDLVKNGSPDENAALLSQALVANATRFGVNSLHLITHSKGTTDSRRFFTTLLPTIGPQLPLKILDLYSIGAPSEGTILSDYALVAEKLCSYKNGVIAPSGDTSICLGSGSGFDPVVENFIVPAQSANWMGAIFGAAPRDPARAAQTIAAMRDFNKANPKSPLVPYYYSIAGNADQDNNQRINTASEAYGFIDFAPSLVEIPLADLTYQALGRTTAITLTETSTLLGLGASRWALGTAAVLDSAQPNDLVSTADSTNCSACGFVSLGTFNFNHFNLKNSSTIDKILTQILNDYPFSSPASSNNFEVSSQGKSNSQR